MFAAVNDFLNKDLLSQASPDNQAQPDRKPDPDLKVRTALDRASAKIGARFAERAGRGGLDPADNRRDVPPARDVSTGAFECEAGASSYGSTHSANLTSNTLKTKLLAGSVLLSDGKLSEAEPLLLQAMNGLTRVSDAERLGLLDATQSVAQLYTAQGKLSEAERLLIQVRAGYAKIASANPLQTISATNSLAMVYDAQKKPEKAKPLLLEIVKNAPRELGHEHPLTLAALNNLATVSRALGSKAEALELFEEVLETKRQRPGRQAS